MDKFKSESIKEFCVGGIVQLVVFQKFDYYLSDLIKPNGFEVFHGITPHQTLSYRAEFKNPAQVRKLYLQLDDVSDEEFSRLMSHL